MWTDPLGWLFLFIGSTNLINHHWKKIKTKTKTDRSNHRIGVQVNLDFDYRWCFRPPKKKLWSTKIGSWNIYFDSINIIIIIIIIIVRAKNTRFSFTFKHGSGCSIILWSMMMVARIDRLFSFWIFILQDSDRKIKQFHSFIGFLLDFSIWSESLYIYDEHHHHHHHWIITMMMMMISIHIYFPKIFFFQQ